MLHRLVLIGLCFVGLATVQAQDPQALEAARQVLQRHKIGTEDRALIQYLNDRCLDDEGQKRARTLVTQLGARSFGEREKAEQELVKYGPAVRTLLQQALSDADPERKRRAERCLEAIEGLHGPHVTGAVVLLLSHSKPAEAVRTLVTFLAFAGDESSEADVADALVRIIDFKKLARDDPLTQAAISPVAARRAAAGHVLGRSPDAAQRKIVYPLLEDKDFAVRLRTCGGLINGNDKAAVPALVRLLREAPEPVCWQAEEWLLRLAGEPISKEANPTASEASRKTWADAWAKWWKDNESKVDLVKAARESAYLHLTLIPEMHGNQISEVDRTGRVLWKLTLSQPRCAQPLPGGRFLVGEARTNLVSERDRKGTILWKYTFNDPSFCERVPGGNTILGNGQGIIEVTPEGKEVMSYKPGDGFFIHGMCRKANGHLVLVSMNGTLREITAKGQEVFSVKLQAGNKGGMNWCHVQALPSDRYLVTDIEKDVVWEVDREAKIHWEYSLDDACCAQRLANGHTVIQSFSQRKIIEVDRDKKVVWEYKTPTTGWRFARR